MKEDLKWLTDPTIFRVNRLDAHSDHIAYVSEEELKGGQSSLYQSLNGEWKFKFSETINERPTDFYEVDYDISDFAPIQVPGHIELQGYGQIQYINTLYPWDGHSNIRPPEIDPNRTTVGSYVRKFDLDDSLKGKDIYISFQGVEKAFYVWLNGEFIGYSEDSFTPSDFKLSPYIKDKDNILSVQVFQNSSASWLEDQDMFRFSGIFRDVFLYAKPEIHIDDVWFKTDIDNEEGILEIRLKLTAKEDNYSIDCSITDPDGKIVFNNTLNLKDEDYKISETIRLENIKLWNYGFPNLYKVLLTVKNSEGEVVELVPYDIGFRKLELKDGVIYLNGERLFIKGVNRHEWSPEKGRAISKEDIEADFNLIQENNINGIRTSHYPNQSYLYELSDKNGLYIMDETNLETHGSWQKLMKVDPEWNVPGDLPEWKDAVLDRAISMFERDKNHPSILFWSVGNESFAGADLMAMADFFRENDSSRLVHYEGSFHNREWNDISDVESQMYPSPESIREYLENNPRKPFIVCEFMHDMGNSLGGLDSYMNLGEEFDMYQGGFIWDFKDQALWKTDEQGNRYLAYGGDHGERQSDYNFSGNGIVFADLTEKPALQEVKYLYQSKEDIEKANKENKELKEKYQASVAQEKKEFEKVSNILKVVKGDGAIGVSGDDFEILFSIPEGGPVSLIKDGKEWLWRAPKPAYWRAPTENDIGNKFAHNSSIWQAAENFQISKGPEILEENDDLVKLEYSYSSPAISELNTKITYTVYNSGKINVNVKTNIPDSAPQLPVFGVRFMTPEIVKSYKWIGIEGETYPDRMNGTYGEFSAVPGVEEYLVPQEYGNHMDTLKVVIEDQNDAKLKVYYDQRPFNFSIIPYTPNQLQDAYHKYELPKPVRTVITINGFMRGVGGIDTWGSDIEEKYQLKEKEYEFSFDLI